MEMGKKLDEEIINQIPSLYEKYKNKTKVAEELNVSVATVNKYLNIYNATPIKVIKKQRIKVDDELIERINTLYKSYKNMSQVAKELGISSATVKNHLSEENLALKEKINDDRDALWFYIYKLFGPDSEDYPVSKWNITQMTKFNSMGINYRAQLLTLKFFYEIEKHPVQERYKTIGIIPYKYDAAAAYYKRQEKKKKELEEAIERQLEQDRIEIKINPADYIGKRKKKKMIDLNSIAGDENG